MEAKKEAENINQTPETTTAPEGGSCLKCQEGSQDQAEKVESEQNGDYKDRFVRAIADFNNFKARVEKDKKSWTATSKIEVVKQFLPLIDDFFRVMESAPEFEQGSKADAWKSGVIGVCKNVDNVLKKLGVTEIDCSGQFDPQLHEALCKVPADNKFMSGDIVQVLRKGYSLDGTVVRHAQVSVAD